MAENYVRFWGVRGSYPTPFPSHLQYGGNTTCLEIRAGNHLAIIDGGSGIIPLGDLLMRQQDITEFLLLFTHYHWDHISGMPFFVPAFVPRFSIRITGPGNSPEEVKHILGQQMKAPYFPVETETWLADVQYLDTRIDHLEHGPIKLQRFVVHHPGTTYGYRITVNDRHVVFVPDQELLFIDQPINLRLVDAELGADEKRLLEQMKEEEKWSLLKPMMNAHALIHDAQYTPEDYASKRGWGHSCYVDTVNCAIDAGARSLYLFHHDPGYPDHKLDTLHHHARELIRDRGADVACHLAQEGLIIDFDAL
ncbi:MAG: MBL fold metallo-hydrolase [Gammaproteobacteria bacterium]|nr:MBL fold metallo-hydrolase [Gammaproteobacteria bacterium]